MRGPTEEDRRQEREEEDRRGEEERRRSRRPRDPRLHRVIPFRGANQVVRRLTGAEANIIRSELSQMFGRLQEQISLLIERRRQNDAFDDLMATVLSTLSGRFAEELTAVIYNATQRSIQNVFDERPLR